MTLNQCFANVCIEERKVKGVEREALEATGASKDLAVGLSELS